MKAMPKKKPIPLFEPFFLSGFLLFPFPTLCYSQMTSNELLTDLLSLPSFPELACFALVGYYDSSGREVTTRLQTLIMRAMDWLTVC